MTPEQVIADSGFADAVQQLLEELAEFDAGHRDLDAAVVLAVLALQLNADPRAGRAPAGRTCGAE